jgi:hypothetical protein
VTSDNPRSESPTRIIDEICHGFASRDHVQTCADRNLAIQLAVKMAQPGDVVIIAGRGHESIQQIGTRSISFDDRKVTRRILRELQASQFPPDSQFLFPRLMLAAGACPLNPNEPGSILISVLETLSCSPATLRS